MFALQNPLVEVDWFPPTALRQGYALVEYENKDQADAAIEGMDGKKLLGQEVHVDYAFVKGEVAFFVVCRGLRSSLMRCCAFQMKHEVRHVVVLVAADFVDVTPLVESPNTERFL